MLSEVRWKRTEIHIILLMWNIKQKVTKELTKQEQIQATEWWLPEGKGVGEKKNWVKKVNYKVMEGSQTFGGEHIIEYIDIKL